MQEVKTNDGIKTEGTTKEDSPFSALKDHTPREEDTNTGRRLVQEGSEPYI